MNITVVAILCHLIAGNNVCFEVKVTDSNLEEGLNMYSCTMGAQASMAKWKNEHPVYSSEKYTIQGWKCALGPYNLKGGV